MQTEITFNRQALDTRKAQAYQECIEKITEAWESGYPYVDLEVPSDLSKEVRSSIISNVANAGLKAIAPKGGFFKVKSGKTQFRIINKNYIGLL